MQFGMVNLDVMDLRGRFVRRLNQRTNLPACLRPRNNFSRVATQIFRSDVHKLLLRIGRNRRGLRRTEFRIGGGSIQQLEYGSPPILNSVRLSLATILTAADLRNN